MCIRDSWYVGGDMDADPVPDICFVQKIKDQMTSHYLIDTNRIYAMGTSNGGGLCYWLAANVSWLSAIAPIAAYQWNGYDLEGPPTLPVIQTHGTADYTTVSYTHLDVYKRQLFLYYLHTRARTD